MTENYVNLYACAKRELEVRRRVYPKWVADGRMYKEKADREIRMMEEIARHFEQLAGKERLI